MCKLGANSGLPACLPLQDKVLLNDAWQVALLWSEESGGSLNATWRQLTPLQPAGETAPAPRRGHSAVMLLHPDGPQMVGMRVARVPMTAFMRCQESRKQRATAAKCVPHRWPVHPEISVCWPVGIRPCPHS